MSGHHRCDPEGPRNDVVDRANLEAQAVCERAILPSVICDAWQKALGSARLRLVTGMVAEMDHDMGFGATWAPAVGWMHPGI